MKESTKQHYQNTVEEIKRHIAANINEDITLTTLSKKFAISSFHLSRVFKQITGVSLNGYLQTERLNKSFFLVVYTSVKILDAAIASGFNDYETFSRSFKRHFKVAPDDLRKIIKQIKSNKDIPANASVVMRSAKEQHQLSQKELLQNNKTICELVYKVERNSKPGKQKFIINPIN